MKIRKEVKWFADEMEKVLKENDFKGGWSDNYCDEFYLRDELKNEVKELSKELGRIGDTSPRSKESIIKECVDVANFAMMIADRNRN